MFVGWVGCALVDAPSHHSSYDFLSEFLAVFDFGGAFGFYAGMAT